VILRAEAFFAGLRVDVSLVIGFFAEVGFRADFCVFAGFIAFAILSSPSCIWSGATKIDSRDSSVKRRSTFFSRFPLLFRLTLVPLRVACLAEWIACAFKPSSAIPLTTKGYAF
jgi:hypothetical protein